MRTTCMALVGLLLVACGGGGSNPTVGVGIGGTGKTGVVFGDVDIDGGIRVGRTLFTTVAADVRIGGVSATPKELRKGHVALVAGLIDGATGVAESITVEDIVRGVLQERPNAHALRVQGQIVEIDERTVYGESINPSSADGLAAGDLLRVWGFVKGPGLVRATRIERESEAAEIRVVGIANDVDASMDRFRIGGQGVDHSEADVSKLPQGDPQEDDLVSVRAGTVLNADGEIVAQEVALLGIDAEADNETTGLEGFVTAVFPGLGIRVGSSKVRTSAETIYVGGGELDLVVGAEVAVEGPLEGGVVQARKVRFVAGVRVESNIAAIAGELFAVKGLPGLVIRLDGLTAFGGAATEAADLKVGDHIQVRARRAGPTTIVALEVLETPASALLEFQGPVDASPAPSNPEFTILGVLINTTDIADDAFESPNGDVIGRANFFARLAADALVRVRGVLVGGSPQWGEARAQDE